MKIGVLALQGAFIEHCQILHQLGVETKEIRQKSDFTSDIDGLILPGGESTVIGKLLRELELLIPIQQAIEAGLPAFGTCAGMILLAQEIANSDITHLGVLNARVQRNAYGRQLGSFTSTLNVKGVGEVPAIFIRAPYIESLWGEAEPLAFEGDKIVAARQNNILATSFHPELTSSTLLHQYFLDMVASHGKAAE